jgi:hypothetical protein
MPDIGIAQPVGRIHGDSVFAGANAKPPEPPKAKRENDMPEQFTTWGAAIESSVSNALSLFLATIPKIIGFLLILGIGWTLAALTAGAAAAILRRMRFNDMAHRSGLAGVVQSTGMDTDAIGFVALSTKWFIRLIALVVAFDALGLAAVSETLRQLLLWLPNLIVALVILVLGGLAANSLRNIVRASAASGELGNPTLLASLAYGAVWAFAIIVAVYQVGIASELVATLFTALVAALALAVGLAFGLGGRETAGQLIHDLYVRWRGAPGVSQRRSTQDHAAIRREH